MNVSCPFEFLELKFTACLHYRLLWRGMIQFDPDWFLSTVYTTKLNSLQSVKKKLEPTIITFIEYKLLMMLNDSCANIIMRSVGGDNFWILWSWFTTHSYAYLFVLESFCFVLEAVLPYHHLYAALLLHFINIVTILAVVLRILIPCFRAKLICRFTTVYTGWLERTRSSQTHIPF